MPNKCCSRFSCVQAILAFCSGCQFIALGANLLLRDPSRPKVAISEGSLASHVATHRTVYLVRVRIYCFALALGANLLLCTWYANCFALALLIALHLVRKLLCTCSAYCFARKPLSKERFRQNSFNRVSWYMRTHKKQPTCFA